MSYTPFPWALLPQNSLHLQTLRTWTTTGGSCGSSGSTRTDGTGGSVTQAGDDIGASDVPATATAITSNAAANVHEALPHQTMEDSGQDNGQDTADNTVDDDDDDAGDSVVPTMTMPTSPFGVLIDTRTAQLGMRVLVKSALVHETVVKYTSAVKHNGEVRARTVMPPW